jgi:hypothetical protein
VQNTKKEKGGQTLYVALMSSYNFITQLLCKKEKPYKSHCFLAAGICPRRERGSFLN